MARKTRARAKASAPNASLVLPLALIALACAATYWNSLGSPFIWDDNTAIVNNQSIHQLWTPFATPRETPVAGRPIVNLTFALNYAAGGVSVAGYHVVNVAVHLACALLLFGIARRTFMSMDARDGATPSIWSADTLALGASLLWLVHPINSEAVNYITQRTESLMALFFFLTLYCAIRARRSAFSIRWDAAAIIACALGMASKESMVVAPLVVVLYDRIFEFDSAGDAVKARKWLYAGLAATWLELGGLMWYAQRSTLGTSATVSRWTYLLNQAPIITHYLGLTIWPRALVLDYGVPQAVALRTALPALMLVGGLAVATVVAVVRWPRAGFLGAVFFLTLAPTSSIVPILTEVGAERRMYVPFAALAVLVIVLLRAGTDAIARRAPARATTVVNRTTEIVVVILLALAVRTLNRNEEYAEPVSLWQSTLAERPHGRAQYSLGAALINAGQEDEGIAALRRAVPQFPDARFALGTELYAVAKMDEAGRVLEEFVHATPPRADRVPGHALLARIYIAQGRFPEAARQFEAALQIAPSNPDAQQGLNEVQAAERLVAGDLLRRMHAEEAEAQVRDAVRIAPRDGEAHNLLGAALASQGKVQEAIAEFRAALDINPQDTQAQNNLAQALRTSRPAR